MFAEWDDTKVGISLPIRGKTYTITPMGYLDEIRIRRSTEAVAEAIANDTPIEQDVLVRNEEFQQMILGPVLEQMRGDNLPSALIMHAATVAHTYNIAGREAAEKRWAEGPDPEALAAEMQAAQAKIEKLLTASRPSRSTASGNRTRKASTTSTTSRQGTRRSAAKPAATSRGRKSSTPAT